MGEIAEINPKADRPADDTPVSFVPMAALDADVGQTLAHETRSYSAVVKGYSQFRRDDLLVAKITPCFENGKIGRAAIPHELGAGSTEFHVVRPDTASLDASYALHFLRLPRVRRAGELRMTGSAGQRRVPEQFLAALSIPLPPLQEQRRIARVLDAADAVRTMRRRSIESASSFAAALYRAMFGGLHSTNDVATLGEVSDVTSGITKGRRINGQVLTEVPYLAVSNVQAGRLDMTNVKTIEASESEIALTAGSGRPLAHRGRRSRQARPRHPVVG
jgi:type I restriction enzyme S subunit